MSLDPLTAVLDIGGKVIDRLWPDPATRDAAKLELFKAERAGELDGIKTQLSAIIAEANSTDPWTSRARPSFLYVIYTMILIGVPMGVLSAFQPDIAARIATGMQLWLKAIPDSLWTLFGVGYLGYTGARTWDKARGVAAK